MDVRLQMAMVFHLDKCIGCHTCSVADKNVWNDRRGAEYMWWNNVETKPGTGYPTGWEDQERYRGGWERTDSGEIRLRGTSKAKGFANIFSNPYLPSLDDYYEPFTYRYEDLFTARDGADQPTARPISKVTGKPLDLEAGPNWDDDLSGSPVYATNDPNFPAMTPEEQQSLFALDRLVFFYIPRICNHCANPGCLSACPAGAIYKRGEDGIVLVSQEACRGWRFCVTGCPYKKTYYNWSTGKSEKCILCYPRIETGQEPACFHVCVGRIRYLGGLLYDADRIVSSLQVANEDLVEAQLELLLDPSDPEVIAGAHANRIDDLALEAVRRSPVYHYVKRWRLALPLHPEFRTLPMLYYVPPLQPVIATVSDGIYDTSAEGLFAPVDHCRAPVSYLARLFGGGNEAPVRHALKKMLAVRMFKRLQTVGDVPAATVQGMMDELGTNAGELEEIYRLTALATPQERYVFPPSHREVAEEMLQDDVRSTAGETGLGFDQPPRRGE